MSTQNWGNQPITPFWFYCQHVLPLVYDESLSYYEVLCKLQAKLNEVIKTQNELQDAFQNLLTWVDTQLETYTKEQLQKWLNDGTLEAIIKSILITSYFYETTSDMINDMNLKNNDKCFTLGYYTLNDKGMNEWLISETQPSTFYVTLENGLYAKRVITGKANVIQYGLKENINQPQNSLIQQIIDENNYVEFNKGNYYVTLATPYSLNCHDDLTINGNGAMIKGIGSYDSSYYTILGVSNNNIKINNLIIDGAKDIVTVTGEHGMCTTITGSNVSFENVIFQNAFGDGAIIDKYAKNIIFENCMFDNCRRQGISITGCNNVIIRNCDIQNIKGTAPSNAIDIEPYEDMNCKNIIIENVNIKNCDGYGIQGFYREMTTKNTSVYINNVNIENCLSGLLFGSLKNVGNVIDVRNVIIKNTLTSSINLNDIISNYNINFDNITLINYNNNAVLLTADTIELSGVNFNNLIFIRENEPWNNINFLFTNTKPIKNIRIKNTNADLFKNWQQVENLIIENQPLYVSTDTTIDFNEYYHSEIYVDSNITLLFNNFVGAEYSQKTSPIKIYVLNNWDVTVQSVSFNKSLSIIGNNGTKISGTSGGANLTIQGIRNLLCITNYTGNWVANN